MKHNNACGLASRPTISEAYNAALACDPTSAFGGVLISNTKIDLATAQEINKLFCEVVIAPSYDEEAIAVLEEKKNRIILIQNEVALPAKQVRTCLNGLLIQERNDSTDTKEHLKTVTTTEPTSEQIEDLSKEEAETATS